LIALWGGIGIAPEGFDERPDSLAIVERQCVLSKRCAKEVRERASAGLIVRVVIEAGFGSLDGWLGHHVLGQFDDRLP